MSNLKRIYIEDKSVVWFSKSNRYVVLENLAADILVAFDTNTPTDKIINNLINQLKISKEEAKQIVSEIHSALYEQNILVNDSSDLSTEIQHPTNSVFEITKYYLINSLLFKVDYQSEFEVYLVHPKFAHLEVNTQNTPDHIYQITTTNEITSLIIDDQLIGNWHRKDIHYFQGKFSMYIVQHMHNKPEDEWMGVFHASGLGNEKKSILLLGDSGNGKSTSLAILQANGFTCFADDFVPIDIQHKHIHTFPSAISIKKNSLNTLLPLYPELKDTAEYHFKRLGKIVRFLPPKTIDYSITTPCNDLVFIKYEKDSELKFSQISKIEAFQQLIPDSWLSKESKNVTLFLDWFSKVNCYQLTYSENDKMVKTIKNILNNEL